AELVASREACGPEVTMKVILETSSLVTAERIRKAADIAMKAGADFIKSSTGMRSSGATVESATAMMQAVRDHERETGRRVGIKLAGGIRKAEQALEFISLADRELGPGWASPEHFRIGALALLDDLVDGLAP